ncbi:cold-regulated protein 27 isoform X2 [Elaeis guineensis]|uniref:Uncharacterized protein LOC105060903 isoform X2 n=1 Tax=Elaeis guineensis var. tenera TaxID=51953 RepID=A0A8N4ESR3_ELAGV|nr:uncharacterized protein LOC105060903 isoform X2 [Elaeis guineensis]
MDDGFRTIPASLPDSAVSVKDPGGFAGHEESSKRAVNSISTEWTDEKHNLYLNSIEASFTSQLCRNGHHSKDSLGWLPMLTPKHPKPAGSNCNSLLSGQVLRKGCWETLNYERTRTHADIEKEIHLLSANPWIQHFKSPIIGREVHLMLTDQMDNNELASQARHFESQRHKGESTTAEQFQAWGSQIYRQDSVGSNTEVSDQNFVDKDSEGEKFGGSSRRKRVRN